MEFKIRCLRFSWLTQLINILTYLFFPIRLRFYTILSFNFNHFFLLLECKLKLLLRFFLLFFLDHWFILTLLNNNHYFFFLFLIFIYFHYFLWFCSVFRLYNIFIHLYFILLFFIYYYRRQLLLLLTFILRWEHFLIWLKLPLFYRSSFWVMTSLFAIITKFHH